MPLHTPRFAFLAALGLFVALALFGARYHWVEEAGTAERDGFVAKAEELLAGSIPEDPFRPLLYPLATAGLARLGLAPFTAARLISNLAAVGLVLLAWGFGRRLGGPRAGAWAMAATAVNPNVWILGQHTTTDMPFAALAGAAWLAAFAHLERPGAATATAAGAAYGAAAFTRGSALFLLPGLALAWLLAGRRRPARGSLRDLGLAAGAALLFLAPHWALRAAAFGDPFHDENWKNLAWKLYGYPDWSYLGQVPFDGLGAVIAADPWAVVAGGLSELARFAGSGLAQLMGTPLHALLLVAGAAVALSHRPRRAGWLLFAAGSFLVGVAFAFFAWGRLLLVLLPVGNALAFSLFGEPGDRLRERLRAWREGAGRFPASLWSVAAATVVLLLAVKTFAFRLPAFVDRHPFVEVEILRQLQEDLPPGAALAGTSPFLGRYLDRSYVYVPDAFGEEIERPELYYAGLRSRLEAAGVRFLVAGEIDLRDRPVALLGTEAPVPWLEPIGAERGVSIWRVGSR